MIPFLSKNISSFLIANRIIAAEELDTYSYCFEILFATVLNFLAICVLALATGMVAETIFFLAAFLPFRRLAGGYHAKNHARCFVILMSVYILFLLIMKFGFYLHIDVAINLCLLLSGILIFLLAPIVDPNKPVAEKIVFLLKRKSRIMVFVYVLAAKALTALSAHKNWALSLSLGILTVALSLAATMVKNKITAHSLPCGK
ncbi:accessory gene regulator [Clostridia bacterium]|nr:accessory gene regulator [Clostridia bacterium]